MPLLSGEEANPGNFDFSSYQREKGITATLSALYGGEAKLIEKGGGNLILRIGYYLRQEFNEALAKIPTDRGGIIAGLFLGDTTALDQDTLDTLSQTGIRHAFCVSGLHVGFVVLFVHLLASLFHLKRRGVLLFLAPALLLYAAVTGFYPAVCRASIMSFLIYAATAQGRPGDGFSGLALAGFIILLWQPSTLWLAGFQLSFVAMFSILYFLPYLRKIVKKDFPGKDALLVTIAAQILMLPLIAYCFQTVSLISLFINTICCSLVGGVVVLALCALILAPFSSFIAAAPLVLAGIIAEAIIKAAHFLTTIPLAYYYRGAFPLSLLLLCFLVLIIIPRITLLQHRPLLSAAAIVSVMLITLFPWQIINKDNNFTITFLSVGEGDCAYISTPEGNNILIDAAGEESQSTTINKIRPFLLHEGVNTLDYIFLSHTDEDHAASLPYLLDFFKVEKTVFTQAGYYYNDDYKAKAQAAGAEVITVETGDSFTIGGVDFEILYPDKEEVGTDNALSMVLLVNYQDFNLLFTGDADKDILSQILTENQDLKADVLKIPHHGSATGYNQDFYRETQVKTAVISVGENNYGHPDYEILNYFVNNDIPIYRTDLDGAVTVTFNQEEDAFTVDTYSSHKHREVKIN